MRAADQARLAELCLFGAYDPARHARAGVLLEGLRMIEGRIQVLAAPLSTPAHLILRRKGYVGPGATLAIRSLIQALRIASQGRRLRGRPVIVVPHPAFAPALIAKIKFGFDAVVVLDFLTSARETLLDHGKKSRTAEALAESLDRRTLRLADLVIVDTEEHRLALPDSLRSSAAVVPVGATHGWFKVPALSHGRSTLRVIHYSTCSPLHGVDTILEAAARTRDRNIEFTIVGPLTESQRRLLRRTEQQVRLNQFEWLPEQRLRELTSKQDVCLGIFGHTAKARRVVPAKVFQGAAAGRAVVTSDSDPQRRLLGDTAVFVPPADSAALAVALERLAANPQEVRHLAAASRRTVQPFSSERVVVPLLERISTLVTGTAT